MRSEELKGKLARILRAHKGEINEAWIRRLQEWEDLRLASFPAEELGQVTDRALEACADFLTSGQLEALHKLSHELITNWLSRGISLQEFDLVRLLLRDVLQEFLQREIEGEEERREALRAFDLSLEQAVIFFLTGIQEELNRRATHLEVLNKRFLALQDISASVASTLSLDEVLQRVVTGLESLDFEMSGLMMVDEEGRALRWAAYNKMAREFLREVEELTQTKPAEIQIPLTEERNLSVQVAKKGQEAITHDLYDICVPFVARQACTVIQKLLNLRAFALCPLKIGASVLGVMLAATRREDISPGELGVLRALANQAAVAIENAHLYKSEQDKRLLAETLQEVTAALSSALDLDELLNLILGQLRRVVEFDSAAMMLQEGDVLAVKAAKGFPDIEAMLRTHLPLEKCPLNRQVMEKREPLIVPDVQKEPLWWPMPGGERIRSWMCIPLVVKDKAIGVITIDKHQPGFYKESDASVAMAFANYAAVAVWNARLYTEKKRRADELAILYEIGLATASALELKELLPLIHRQISRVMDASTFYIALYDEERGELHFEFILDQGKPLERFSKPVEEGGIGGWVVRSRQSLLIKDWEREKEKVPVEAITIGTPTRSWLGVPMMTREKLIGLISVQSYEPHAFDEAHQRLLEAIAHRAAIAIENARLYEQLAHRVQELEKFYQVGSEIVSSLELRKTLQLVIDCAVEAIPAAQKGSLHLLDERRNELVMVASHGFSREVMEAATFKPGEGYTGWVFAHRQPAIIDNVKADPRTKPIDLPEVLEEKSAITVPLIIRGKAVGTITLDNLTTYGAFNEDDLRLLCAFANYAAIAIENAKLYEEEQKKRQLAHTLQEISKVLSSTLELDDVLNLILEQLEKVVNYDSAAIMLLFEDVFKVVAGRGFPDPKRVLGLSFPVEKDALGRQILQTKQPLVLFDAQKDERFLAAGGTEYTRAWIGAPLIVKGEVIGLLTVDNREPGIYDEEAAQMVMAFASQAAVAIENARLYEDARARVRELSALTQVGEAINRALSLEEILDIVLREAMTIVGKEEGSIILHDPTTDTMRIVASYGLPREVIEHFNSRPVYAHEGTFGIVLKTGEMLEIADARHDPRVLQEAGKVPDQLTNIPLRTEEGVIGVIALDVLPPDDRARRLLLALADLAAMAIQRAQLFEEERRRVTQLALIGEVSKKATSILDMDRMLREVTRTIQESFNYYNVAFFVLDEEKREAVLRAVAGGFEHIVPGTYRQSVDEGIIGFVIRTGKSWLANDVSKDPYYIKGFLEEVLTKSELCVPIKVGGKVIGALDIQSTRLNDFDHEDITAMETVADRIAIAIENARLYQEERLRREALASLSQTNLLITSELDLDRLLQTTTEEAARLFAAPAVGLYLLDEKGQCYRLRASYGLSEEYVAGQALPRDKVEAAFGSLGQATVMEELWEKPFGRVDLIEKEDIRSVLVAPLRASGRLMGGLCIYSKGEPRRFTDAEAELARALADQAMVAIENARLYQEAQQRVRELEALQEVGLHLTSSLELPSVLEAIAESTLRLIKATNVDIFLYDPEADALTFGASLWEDGRKGKEPALMPRSEGLTMTVARTGQPLVVEDAEHHPLYADPEARRNLKAVAGFPLKKGEEVLGVINVIFTRPHAFSQEELRILSLLANQAAIAIDNAKLYEERRKAYEELKTAQEHLVRAERLQALGQMAGGIAHDFNNLLTVILGRAQLLMHRLSDEMAKREVEAIIRAAQDGAETVRRIQEFSRFRAEPFFSYVDVNQVVQEAVKLTEPRWKDEAQAKGLTIDMKLDLASDLPLTAAEPVGLRQVLVNIIFNAVEAMPQGGRITLRTWQEGDSIKIAVTDTGIGMSDGVKRRIFEPFFTTKGPQKTGLGLSVAYGIIQRHGGEIEVESEEGKGTTFVISLPIRQAARPWPASFRPSTKVAKEAHILIIDDEEEVREVLARILELKGHRVTKAASGKEGLEAFQKTPFDLVFTDLGMPEMPGWEVVAALRKEQPHIPIVLVTGWGTQIDSQEAARREVEVLSKPFLVEEVLGMVDRLLRR